MSKPLVFWMGRALVVLPLDRRYAPNHMWALAEPGGLRVGLSAYAVRLLGEIHRLGWSVQPGARMAAGDTLGYIEASKATSDLYSPVAGTVIEFNPAVLAKPSLVNSSLYDAGWLLRMRGDEAGLLKPEEYLAHLHASWPLVQRLLKQQMQPGASP